MNFSTRAALCLASTCALSTAHAAHPRTPAPSRPAFTFGRPGRASQVSRTVRITAYGLTFRPKTVRVRPGQTVKFVVTDKGTLVHEFVLGTAAEQQRHEREMRRMAMQPGTMKMTQDRDPNAVVVKPGQSRALIWTFTKPGTLEYACHEPGHFAAGMEGIIRVGPALVTQGRRAPAADAPAGREDRS